MIACWHRISFLLLLAFAIPRHSVESAAIGQVCETDSDCDGNLDCTVVQFKRICVPVKCATLAAQAVIESGFDAEKYVADIRADAGLSLDAFKTPSLGKEDNALLEKAMNLSPPPIDIFTANYTACLDPDQDPDERKLQARRTWYGLQWGVSALLSYIGRSTWGTEPGGESLQRVENCLGMLVGVDVGIDVLFQIIPSGEDVITAGSFDLSVLIPIVTIGPVGVAISTWDGPGEQSINSGLAVEVTFGPSLGLSLGGYHGCFANVRSA